jgi:hypothetical protein
MTLQDPIRESSDSNTNSARKKLVWILGIVIVVIFISAVSIGTSQNVKYNAKIESMTELADRVIPESDWVGGKTAITGNSSCVSFDQDCHVLFRNWNSEEPVDIEKMADQLAIPMEHTMYPEDCMRSTDDGGRTEICAYESASLGNWQISLRIRDR